MNSLKPKLKRVRPLLGTFVEISLHSDADSSTQNEWITAGFACIEDIDQLMSIHRPDSDLSRLNRAAAGAWIDIHPHTAAVLKASEDLHLISEGYFDVRCSRIARDSSSPVEVRGNRARRQGHWTMDLGGIAKGYAVDCAVEKIKSLSRGIRVSGLVNAGGDLRRWGPLWPNVSVATSAVRSSASDRRLSKAVHRVMPEGRTLRMKKAVTIFSRQCLWSDALTKVAMTAPAAVTRVCLRRYQAHCVVLA